MTDTWASGDLYEPFIGRWSRLVAAGFLDWLDAESDRTWLDVGCGTGALSQAILDRCQPATVTGIDPSPDYVDWTAGHTADDRARFQVADAEHLPAGPFDVVVSGLVLNFVPDVETALAALRQATSPGGTVAAYLWDYADRMEILRRFWDAALVLNPAAAPLDEGVRFPLCQPDRLADGWRAAGLADVEVDVIEPSAHFFDFDDYWTPFLGGQGPAPGYVATLGDDARQAVQDALRESLPIAADGSITLAAGAIAVRGRRP